MANAVYYSNLAQQTTLSGNISSGALSINVAATTGFPNAFPYTLALDYGAATEELVSVTSASGTTLTVTRGYGGTSAQSHSLGAVVRHVYNAQDATDFRTHEAATAAVHGVAGTLVGTSDTQTLSNKTLTSPTINGGALSGTFSGTPTFSGTATFTGSTTAISASGEIAHSNLYRGTRANATDSQWESRVSGDANARFYVRADGSHNWGPGSALTDLSFQRASAGAGQLNGIFAVSSSNTGVVDHLLVNTSTGANAASNLLNLKNNGTSIAAVGATGTVFSTPSGSAVDAFSANLPSGTTGDLLNLRVNSAIQSAMGSDGQFRIYGGNAPTTFTPVWSGFGSGTLSTNVGWYWRIGKLIFVEIYAVLGSNGTGTAGVQVQFPTIPFRDGNGTATTRQFMTGWITNSNGGVIDGHCIMPVFAGDSGLTGGTIRRYDGSLCQGSNFLNGTPITIQGYYRES